jgi:hypothetical protein
VIARNRARLRNDQDCSAFRPFFGSLTGQFEVAPSGKSERKMSSGMCPHQRRGHPKISGAPWTRQLPLKTPHLHLTMISFAAPTKSRRFSSGTKLTAGSYLTLSSAPSYQYSGSAACCVLVDPFSWTGSRDWKALAKLIAASQDRWSPRPEIFAFTRAVQGRIRISVPNGLTMRVEYFPNATGARSEA